MVHGTSSICINTLPSNKFFNKHILYEKLNKELKWTKANWLWSKWETKNDFALPNPNTTNNSLSLTYK